MFAAVVLVPGPFSRGHSAGVRDASVLLEADEAAHDRLGRDGEVRGDLDSADGGPGADVVEHVVEGDARFFRHLERGRFDARGFGGGFGGRGWRGLGVGGGIRRRGRCGCRPVVLEPQRARPCDAVRLELATARATGTADRRGGATFEDGDDRGANLVRVAVEDGADVFAAARPWTFGIREEAHRLEAVLVCQGDCRFGEQISDRTSQHRVEERGGLRGGVVDAAFGHTLKAGHRRKQAQPRLQVLARRDVEAGRARALCEWGGRCSRLALTQLTAALCGAHATRRRGALRAERFREAAGGGRGACASLETRSKRGQSSVANHEQPLDSAAVRGARPTDGISARGGEHRRSTQRGRKDEGRAGDRSHASHGSDHASHGSKPFRGTPTR